MGSIGTFGYLLVSTIRVPCILPLLIFLFLMSARVRSPCSHTDHFVLAERRLGCRDSRLCSRIAKLGMQEWEREGVCTGHVGGR